MIVDQHKRNVSKNKIGKIFSQFRHILFHNSANCIITVQIISKTLNAKRRYGHQIGAAFSFLRFSSKCQTSLLQRNPAEFVSQIDGEHLEAHRDTDSTTFPAYLFFSFLFRRKIRLYVCCVEQNMSCDIVRIVNIRRQREQKRNSFCSHIYMQIVSCDCINRNVSSVLF